MIALKEHLLAILNTVFNSFIFGVTLPQMVPDAAWAKVANERTFFEGPNRVFTSVELQPMVESLIDPPQKQRLVFEYQKSLLRTMLRESYEAVIDYCAASEELPLYKAQPWYQFASSLEMSSPIRWWSPARVAARFGQVWYYTGLLARPHASQIQRPCRFPTKQLFTYLEIWLVLSTGGFCRAGRQFTFRVTETLWGKTENRVANDISPG
jgi:hypothetical protein